MKSKLSQYSFFLGLAFTLIGLAYAASTSSITKLYKQDGILLMPGVYCLFESSRTQQKESTYCLSGLRSRTHGKMYYRRTLIVFIPEVWPARGSLEWNEIKQSPLFLLASDYHIWFGAAALLIGLALLKKGAEYLRWLLVRMMS